MGESPKRRSAVITLAGRRIDQPDARTPRFPLGVVPTVRTRLSAYFRRHRPLAVVCGAACGVDLLALDEASQLGIRRRVVVAGDLEEYKRSSVTDRPGSWGPLFDQVMAEVTAAGDLVIVDQHRLGDVGYAHLNESILDQAEALDQTFGRGTRPTALLVWDGQSRGTGDVTEKFAQAARMRGLIVDELRTL